MSDKLHLGTRKGLIEVTRKNGDWHVGRASFLSVSVPMLPPDQRDSTLYATAEHGHLGTKFHASRDSGATWWPAPSNGTVVKCSFGSENRRTKPHEKKPINWREDSVHSARSEG
jgi:hypothetical protein